jgi:hypothetical protein
MFDVMKDKYISAKNVLHQIYAENSCKSNPKLARASSMIELSSKKPMTYEQLMDQVNETQTSNREPCLISLRRIEAKRRSLLYDKELIEAQSIMQHDKQVAEKSKHMQVWEKYGFELLSGFKDPKSDVGSIIPQNTDKSVSQA